MAARRKSFIDAPSGAYLSILFFMVSGLTWSYFEMGRSFVFLVHSMMLLQHAFTRELGKSTGVKDWNQFKDIWAITRTDESLSCWNNKLKR